MKSNNNKSISNQIILLLSRFPFDENTQKEVERIIRDEQVNWQEVFELSVTHKVLMIVFNRMQPLSPSLNLKDKTKIFKEHCQSQLMANLLNVKELKNLHQICEENNIQIIPYKGVVFSEQVYGSINLRSFNDIDFLYSVKDTERLDAFLKSKGYKAIPERSGAQHFFHRKIDAEYHYVKLVNGRRVLIEPHFVLMNHFIQCKLSEQEIKEYTQTVRILNQELKTFTPEFMFVQLGLHHGAKDSWTLYKFYVDLIAFINQYQDKVNWEYTLRIAEKFGVKKLLVIGLINAKELFNINLPSRLETEVQKHKQLNKIANLYLNYSVSIFDSKLRVFYKIELLWLTRETVLQKWKLLMRMVKYLFFRIAYGIANIF